MASLGTRGAKYFSVQYTPNPGLYSFSDPWSMEAQNIYLFIYLFIEHPIYLLH
jgi:hypothetical protein